MVKKTARMVQTRLTVLRELVEQESSNVKTATAHQVLLCAMALMTVETTAMKSTVLTSVLPWSSNVNRTDVASTIPGSATEMLTVKMAVMKIPVYVVSL